MDRGSVLADDWALEIPQWRHYTRTLLTGQDGTTTACGEGRWLARASQWTFRPKASRRVLASARLEVPAEILSISATRTDPRRLLAEASGGAEQSGRNPTGRDAQSSQGSHVLHSFDQAALLSKKVLSCPTSGCSHSRISGREVR